jgi:hypothetical protein
MAMNSRIIFPLRRLAHLDRESFQDYWLNQHASLVKKHARTLGIIRYQQVHTLQDTRPTKVDSFDGVAEIWADPNVAEGTPSEQRDAGIALFEDERTFIDLARSPIWVAEEDVLLDGPLDSSSVPIGTTFTALGRCAIPKSGDSPTTCRTTHPSMPSPTRSPRCAAHPSPSTA